VEIDGSSYVARRDNTNKAPATNPDDWMLVAAKGGEGDQGDAATISVGAVTTVPFGTPASVTDVGTPEGAIFYFEIPKGQDGTGPGTWGQHLRSQ
jgi:hypothetical protein